MTEDGTCKDCEFRCVGCHGKDRDGAWRCRKWGEYQDKLAEEQQRTSRERLAAIVGRDYTRESRIRFSRKKVNGHY